MNEEQQERTAKIVAAYVSNNSVPIVDLPGIIADVYNSLGSLGAPAPEPVVAAPVPAVPIKKSVTNDFIVCLEDGKKFKSLRRHLMSHYDMSPEDYRIKWNLPADYPMVAPSYAAARSRLAKQMGLGQKAASRRGGRQKAPAEG